MHASGQLRRMAWGVIGAQCAQVQQQIRTLGVHWVRRNPGIAAPHPGNRASALSECSLGYSSPSQVPGIVEISRAASNLCASARCGVSARGLCTCAAGAELSGWHSVSRLTHSARCVPCQIGSACARLAHASARPAELARFLPTKVRALTAGMNHAGCRIPVRLQYAIGVPMSAQSWRGL